MKKKVIGVLVCTLLIAGVLSNIVNANMIKISSKEDKDNTLVDYTLNFEPILNISDNDEISSNKIQLTVDDLDILDDFVNNIEDEGEKEKLQDIFDEIISADGILDLDAVKSIAQSYFTEVLEMAGTEIICGVCDESEVLTRPLGTTLGASTVFEPPYTSCWSWGDRIGGADDYSHSCNQYSGSIGAYASGWIGGATAEAMQKLSFYVGRTKTISVDGKLIYMGGGSTVGIGAFAGTEKTWYYDDNYGRADLDSPWGWDDIIFKIIDIVTLLAPGAPANIKNAIEMIGLIADVEELGIALTDLINAGDAEVKHATFSFSASPGWHTVYAGMRATASGCITGTGVSVAAGQVTSFTLDGIAAPSTPTVSGPGSGVPGQSYEFCAVSSDPNDDDIQYKFNWGDDETSDWSDFVSSGESVCMSYTYSDPGTYTISVKTRDIDLMESGYGEHTIIIITGKPDLTIGNIWSEPSNKNFKQGDDVHIFTEIINDGEADAGSFNIGIKVDNGDWQKLRVENGLPAGYYFELELWFENGWPDDNCHTFTFYVDIDDEIDEEDDSTSDNQKSSELCPKEKSKNHDANKVINQRIKIISSKNKQTMTNTPFLKSLAQHPPIPTTIKWRFSRFFEKYPNTFPILRHLVML